MCNISWSAPDLFLELMDVYQMNHHLRLTVKSNHTSANCPSCSHTSSRSHSRYTRPIQDLPVMDQSMTLLFVSHKWFCDNPPCYIKVFTERYDWLAPNGRRALRAEKNLRKIVFSTSCLAGEKVARAVHLPVSHDVLLTIVHKTNIDTKVSPFHRGR
ncbi:transposase [Bacillus pseudomycoides]|nr:transposase family protein [Bacillus pseudomycoides]MBD5799225.1 transposase [Bacillus pseudomycoides]MED1477497.1 transposase family protein [Bacillus pseudomycoides]MED1538493.1 transposase family protein [Bacillus pseudomycoides]